MPEKPEKVRHVSRSLERHVGAPREHTWGMLLAEIEQASWFPADASLVETVLSLEPPWRRCAAVGGPATGLDLFEGTFVIRDDGPECHVSWGVVVDPDPSPEGSTFLDAAIVTAGEFLDRLVRRAEDG
jgi:phenylpyruvate tautomerase PptA (4-oxalocrotonate tautomerase family)